MDITLVSHTLCPYVQRAAIALAEKQVPFKREYVDLANKPDWFRAISPLGKVPLLKIAKDEEEAVLFESAVILEYLEDTQPNPLHPTQALDRAKHRGWMEVGSSLLNGIGRLYNAKDKVTFEAEKQNLHDGFKRLEDHLANKASGPFFEGQDFSLVDAVFGPIFRYFDVFESKGNLYILEGLPNIGAWRRTLSKRTSVQEAVGADYPELLSAFLVKRQSYISAMF